MWDGIAFMACCWVDLACVWTVGCCRGRRAVCQVLNKKVAGGRFYKKKARIDNVIDDFVGAWPSSCHSFRLTIGWDFVSRWRPSWSGGGMEVPLA